ncbi:MAG: hypothetical protein JJ974_09155 [Phycisphaerales bacterium]|nr:hypothetical protein [Phycisphaerales bacterium]
MRKSATIVLLAALTGSAFGGIVSIDDGLVKSAPEVNDPLRNFGEGDFIQGFTERSSVTLTEDVRIQLGDGSNAWLEAGTVVNSHMIYLDPVGTSTAITVENIEVTFDSDIIGLITNVSHMRSTNELLGLGELNYYNGTDSDYGANGAADVELFEGSTLNLSIRSRLGDYMRVLTVGSVVPTPGSLALLGAAGLVAGRRRR